VGNITIGGTGKTPLVIALVELLKAHGYHPGIISRGYVPRRSASTKPVPVTARSNPAEVGDETVLLANRTRCPLVVCANRILAAKRLLADHPECDIIISDDGLQHYALARDIEIAVLDGKRRLGNGFLLPAGALRELPSRLATVDFVVVNNSQPQSDEYKMTIESGNAYNLLHPEQQQALTAFAGQALHAVAGIGNPDTFFALLQAQQLKIIAHAYPDHHHYSHDDLVFDDRLPVIMTEKDAVKCQALINERYWCLPITATLNSEFTEKLLAKVKACATKN
ncbi:MAG: tetraacyldisaccharide 4'-kinase, partial [Gammaproteobacteria bacterium]|nr:tetraacyldisaccharide 4'-kinase [Gammaproteobacteria bacterium]